MNYILSLTKSQGEKIFLHSAPKDKITIDIKGLFGMHDWIG